MRPACLLKAPKSISKIDMETPARRNDFASDNTAGICPEVWAMLEGANSGYAPSYGDDRWTARACELVCDIFEIECAAYFVANGTAANALALAQLCRAHEAVICHRNAHLQTDECGAPEFFTGGAKLLLAAGPDGKIDIDAAAELIARQPELHAQRPRAISVTQATELGTVYRTEEVAALSEFARQRGLFLHMDGARFANAVATLDCAPKAITWQNGVDVLCFGGTKNGAGAGELVIFFDKGLAGDFEYRVKQAGQLTSKMRFLAGAWVGLFTGEIWLRNARHANRMATELARRLREAKIDIVFPVEANAVFVRLSPECASRLRTRGWEFYQFIEADVHRLMCSWCTSEAAIDNLVADICAAKA